MVTNPVGVQFREFLVHPVTKLIRRVMQAIYIIVPGTQYRTWVSLCFMDTSCALNCSSSRLLNRAILSSPIVVYSLRYERIWGKRICCFTSSIKSCVYRRWGGGHTQNEHHRDKNSKTTTHAQGKTAKKKETRKTRTKKNKEKQAKEAEALGRQQGKG